MTRELENQLKRMYADLDEDLPAAQFTSRVMLELHEPRRRERMLWSLAILAAVAFLGFTFSTFEPVVKAVAVFPRTLLDAVRESWVALWQSPLVYIYGSALGGYALLAVVRRFRIRWM